MMSDQLQSSAPLPQSTILNYVTTISTPTRVRRIARTGIRLASIVHLFLALTVVSATMVFYTEQFGYDMQNLFSNLMRDYKLSLFLFTLTLACSTAQFFFSNAVEAGNQFACRLLPVTLFPMAFAFFLAALALAAIAGAFWNNDTHAFSMRLTVAILTALPILACAVAILLVNDLAQFLTWISKQPTAEKPPTPFLS